MTAEEFLEQYGDTVAKIRRKQRLKESLEAQMLNVTSNLTPDKVQSSSSLQKVAEAVEEALDLAEEIKELLILKNKIRKEIESVINRILTLRGDALYEKYLVLTSEEDIAKVIDRTVDTVHRLIREGKEEVQQILDTEYSEITENNAK
jgi:DNA-directed RNA polymerase specialized sigma24 family protein